ncbi:MAG: glycine--tRNA ligase [Rickettsiales bacterium]|jgi:glycyl-tRNA synthetase|nr:glycine--tRNA ligase [Rickettsiales bacterium]
MPVKSLEDLASFCKRRGFAFQSSEIYGGLKGFYDLGPLGVELMKNIRDLWWNAMVYKRDDVEGLEAALINNPLVWRYSGHEAGFSDPLVECKKCNARMRQDKMADPTKCDACGSKELTAPRDFKLMMSLAVGPVSSGETNAYLRPETATTTYINFKNVLDSTSRKIPFGMAQIGKAFRNEITPRNFVFRMREFEQAELQFFVHPKDDMEWFEKWKSARMDWWINSLGVPAEKLRFHEHDQLAHYAKAAFDIEYEFGGLGFDEVEGVHNRQDFDLGSHTKAQGEFGIQAKVMENKDSVSKLSYSDPQTGESFIPFVIETAMGTFRAFAAVLDNAYTEEDLGEGNSRIVLKLAPRLSPIKAAVIPLARNVPELVAAAEKMRDELKALGIGRIAFENSGNIGKNYRRHDEIGTPVCITIDHQTLEDGTATIRHRDSMEQTRAPLADIPDMVGKIIA